MMSGSVNRWMFYISSYFPLYIWLIVKNVWDTSLLTTVLHHLYFFGVLMLFVLVSGFQIFMVLTAPRGGHQKMLLPNDVSIDPQSDLLMNYTITYVVPFTTLNIDSIETQIGNLLLFIIIGIMYVNSNAVYLNPVLGLFGYKVFQVGGFHGVHHIISRMSFDDFDAISVGNKKVRAFMIGDGTMLVRKTKDVLEDEE